jgi:enoyl-CoA hydratase
MKELVTYRLDGSIATLSMDDGKVNVVSNAMLAALNGALDRASADKAVVILAGRSGVLSAGFDLAVLSSGKSETLDLLKNGFELALRLYSFPMPVVVACTGHALAMGAFLLMSADYRVGASGAFKIGANEVAIGMTMPHFAIELCRQRLHPAYFQRAMLTAEIFSPEGAAVAGFLDAVVADGVIQAAQEKAAQLAKLNFEAHAATKLRVREQALASMRSALDSDVASFASRLV